ncbi:SulP family inorganic anion transporter, partial [Klebsiella aerogenes]
MNTLRQDSLAGIVVFLVALPLCLGIAQASGLPPFVGLLTGIIGGLVVTALSPSRFAVSGPAAGLVTIVVAAIESLGSFSVFLMALVLAGVLQLLFGILRAGRFISLVPASVIKGMLAAIGILLIMQQIPVALGSAEETELADIVQGNATFSLSAIAVALGGLLVLWLWGSPLIRRVKSLRWIPGPLIAVLLGCATTHTDGLRHALHAGDSSSPSRSPRLPNSGRVMRGRAASCCGAAWVINTVVAQPSRTAISGPGIQRRLFTRRIS